MAPIFNANAKYVNGVGPGYWPTAGVGLNLNLTPGTATCGSPPVLVTYPGGSLPMTGSQTNFVFLDPSLSCAPSSNTTGFMAGQIPLAKVVANSTAITTITDARNWFVPQPVGTDSTGKAVTKYLNNILFADQFPGADAGAKIAACIAALPTTGGIVDARGFQGAQTISSAIVFDRLVQLLIGPAKFSYAGAAIAGGLFQVTNAGRGSSIIGTNRDAVYGDDIYNSPYQPSVINVAPSSGPMDVVVVGNSSQNSQNVMGLRFENFTITATANVRDIFDFECLALGLRIRNFTASGPSPAPFTSGYGMHFKSTYGSGDGADIIVENSVFQNMNRGFTDSVSSMAVTFRNVRMQNMAGAAYSFSQIGVNIIEGGSVEAVTESITEPSIIIANSGPVAISNVHFEDDGGAGTTAISVMGSNNVSITGCRFWKGGGTRDGVTPTYTKKAVLTTGSGNTALRVMGNVCDSLITGCFDFDGASSGSVFYASNLIAGGATEFVGNAAAGVGFPNLLNAAGANQNLTLTPSGTGQINAGTTTGFLTTPTNLQGYFGASGGVHFGCLNHSFTACQLSVMQSDVATGYPITGVYGVALTHAPLGTDQATAVEGDAYSSGASSPSFVSGASGYAEQDGSGTVAKMASLYAQSNYKTAGTVTNNYGLYVDDESGVGTSNYGVYTAGPAPSSFGGAVISGLNTVTFSATPTFDASRGNTQKITLTANVTSSTLSNAAAGEQINFIICQDGTGSRTFVWPATVPQAPPVNLNANACTAYSSVYDGANANPLAPAQAQPNITAVTVGAAVATDQNLMSIPLPAGMLNALGKTVSIYGAGTYTTGSSGMGTMTYKVKLCTVSGCGSGTVITLSTFGPTGTAIASSTSIPWVVDMKVSTAALGASGTVIPNGGLQTVLSATPTAAGNSYLTQTTGPSSATDITVPQFIQFTVADSGASANNTFKQTVGVVHPIN